MSLEDPTTLAYIAVLILSNALSMLGVHHYHHRKGEPIQ